MTEYIEREAAFKAYTDLLKREGDIYTTDVTDALLSIPSADVAPVRHGRWGNRWICSNMAGYEYAYSCSECGKPTYRISTLEPMPPYCPNCGAKMDGGEENE